MKFYKTFEFYSDSFEYRFNRAIYLTYVEQRLDRTFKHCSKADFYNNLEDKVAKVTTVEYEKDRVYNLADTKDIWWSKHNSKLGEVYHENGISSYWINVEN